MIRVNRKLTIKYKLATSVYESLNKAAYATQARSLGTTAKAVNSILSHLTFCDAILPIIIGNNKNNSDWEKEKQDYISSLQVSVPSSGYPLDLNSTFDMENTFLKTNIERYINENESDMYITVPADPKDKDSVATKVLKSEKDIANHILKSSKVEPIDYHQYFKFDSAKDYLYWVLCSVSNQVANTTEDVDKSPNIRFFLFDEKVAKLRNSEKAEKEMEATDKLRAIKADDALIKNIALFKNVITYTEYEEMDAKEVYVELYSYAKNYPSEFLDIANDKTIKTKATIKKYIETGVLTTDANGNIVDASNITNVLGVSLEEATKYLLNPVNSGEVTKFEGKFKALNK